MTGGGEDDGGPCVHPIARARPRARIRKPNALNPLGYSADGSALGSRHAQGRANQFFERDVRRSIRGRLRCARKSGDIGISKAQQLRSLLADGTIDHTALMIGDRAVDIHAAHVNGMPSCGVQWGFGSRDELVESQPTYLITKPDELLRFTAR